MTRHKFYKLGSSKKMLPMGFHSKFSNTLGKRKYKEHDRLYVKYSENRREFEVLPAYFQEQKAERTFLKLNNKDYEDSFSIFHRGKLNINTRYTVCDNENT
jgi:hypothetical protein